MVRRPVASYISGCGVLCDMAADAAQEGKADYQTEEGAACMTSSSSVQEVPAAHWLIA